MESLLKEINNLIAATQFAQSKGAYTLKQSSDIYNTIQNITKMVAPKKDIPTTNSKLESIPENH